MPLARRLAAGRRVGPGEGMRRTIGLRATILLTDLCIGLQLLLTRRSSGHWIHAKVLIRNKLVKKHFTKTVNLSF